MNGVGLIGAIVVGIAAGWIAEQVMNRHHGLLTNLIVGLVGGLIGSFLAGFFNIILPPSHTKGCRIVGNIRSASGLQIRC